MSSVTFPVDLGGDGSTVTDDADPATGLANGGHRQRMVPMFSQGVVMTQTAKTKAAESAASAAGAADSLAQSQSLFNRIYLGGF